MKTGHCRPNQFPSPATRTSPRALASLLLLVTLLPTPATPQDLPAAEPLKLTLHGVVINSVTHDPISRALVFTPDHRLATFTDEEGRFEFSIPEPAPDPTSPDAQAFTLNSQIPFLNLYGGFSARKPGFLTPQTDFWSAPSNPAAQDITIPLVPEALIIGRVALPSSNEAERIQVDLYRRLVSEGRARWIPAGSFNTRSNGDFRFAELEPGTYKLLTGEHMDRDPLTFDPRGPLYGYPPAYFPDATDFETAASIQLTAGTTFQAELTPVRQPYYAVKVPVTNASSDTQLMVNVSVQGRRGPGFALGYNNQDQKIEGSLPNGTYVIEVTSVGPSTATGSATINVKGAPVNGPALTLSPLASVRIHTTLDFKPEPESSPPAAQPNVTLESTDEFRRDNDSPQLRPPRDPHDDSLVFESVSPGNYWVNVNPTRGFAASVTLGDVDLLRRPLVVAPGANLTVDVTVREDGAEITGSLEDSHGNALPVSDATEDISSPQPAGGSFISGAPGRASGFIYCIPLPDSAGQLRETRAMSNGKFTLSQVPPGAYRVLAFDHPQRELEYRNSEAMRAYDTRGQVVRLVAGQKENLRLPVISSE